MAHDIDDLVKAARESFEKWAIGILWAKAIAAAPVLASPWLSWIAKGVIDWFVKTLVGTGELAAFIVNTNVLTSEQAKDYREAIGKVITAPADISPEEWKKLEDEANKRFDDFVRFRS